MTTTSLPLAQIFPQFDGLHLEAADFYADTLALTFRTTATTSACPDCATASSSVHSRYQRQVADVPWGTRPVRVCLRVRKFFCRQTACLRRILTERLPNLVPPRARTSLPLQ